MPKYIITLDPATAAFYGRVALQAGRTEEQVLADALFKLAGELALESLRKNPQIREGNR